MHPITSKSFSTPISSQKDNICDFIRKCQGKYKHLPLRVEVSIPNQLKAGHSDYQPTRVAEAKASGNTLKAIKEFSIDNEISFGRPHYHNDTDFLISIIDGSDIESDETADTPQNRMAKQTQSATSIFSTAKTFLNDFFPSDEEDDEYEETLANHSTDNGQPTPQQHRSSNRQTNNSLNNQSINQSTNNSTNQATSQTSYQSSYQTKAKPLEGFKLLITELIKEKINEELIGNLVDYNLYAQEENQKKICVLNSITITALTANKNELSYLKILIKNNRDKRESKFYLKRMLSEVAPNTLEHFDINNVSIIAHDNSNAQHTEDELMKSMESDIQQPTEEKEKWLIELDYDYAYFDLTHDNPFADRQQADSKTPNIDLMMVIHDAESIDTCKEVTPLSHQFTIGRDGQTSQADVQLASIAKQFSREQLEIRHDGLRWIMKNISNAQPALIIDANKVLHPQLEYNISHQMSVQLGTSEGKGEQYDTYPLIEFLIPSKFLLSEATDPEATGNKVLQVEATDNESIDESKTADEIINKESNPPANVTTDDSEKAHDSSQVETSTNSVTENEQSNFSDLTYTYVDNSLPKNLYSIVNIKA